MKKFFERLAVFRRKVTVFNGRGFLQLVGRQSYADFPFRFVPAVVAVPRFSRFHNDLDFERRHGCSFKDTLITKPKPYNVTYPDIGNPVAREAAKARDFLGNYGNTENFKRG